MIKNVYITTDTHFNHTGIIDFCSRPANFEAILQKHLKNLNQDDVLVHLGDICMGNDIAVHEKYIQPIKAKKILVRGNHDHKTDVWYLEHGWDFVCESFSNTCFGVKCLFSHKPATWDGNFDINLHGHLHNLSHHKDEKTMGLNYLISLERDGYRPLNLRKILEPIKQKLNEIDKNDH